MSGEPKDPAIKLFGKTIPLPEVPPEAAVIDRNQNHGTGPSPEDTIRADEDVGQDNEETSKGNTATCKQEDEVQRPTGEDSNDPDATSGISENNKTTSVDKGSATQKASKSDDEKSETSNTQEKALKKPDKILPCPRCHSMDTKFCYYNNYNVNQPRHFCKHCQRYWTAGGTMRNVPVGAGRRKNKSSASHYHRHITVSETHKNVRIEIPNGVVHPVKPSGTFLAFGSSDAPLCESMASVLNLADKTMQGSPRNGFPKPDGVRMPGPYGEDRFKSVDESPALGPNPKDSEGKNGSVPGFTPQAHVYPGAPWPYPWNQSQWGPTLPPPTPYFPPGFAVPFFPAAAAYWGCNVAGAWSVPWVPGPSSPVTTCAGSSPNSPTLGKHSRDEENTLEQSGGGGGGQYDGPVKEASAENFLWIPKTLRIDDLGEAAKSSIWATLGIKNDKAQPVSGGGLFKAFQPEDEDEERNRGSEASPVLQANPAALSRSVNFHESS